MNQKNYMPPHRVSIWGRKRYSGDTNASDYLDYSLDDIWNSISKLWVLTIVIGAMVCCSKK